MERRLRVRSGVDDVVDGFLAYYPLVGLLLALFLAGLFVQLTTTDLLATLAPYRIFFQVVLAGFAVAFLRNTVGARSYGLFAPVAISFVLVNGGPIWGTLLFLNVFLVSLAAYFVVAPLRLGTGPRLATLLAVVGIGTTIFRVAGDGSGLLGVDAPLAVFFPMIVTAWYADRFAVSVEERGWPAPSLRFLWTLAAIFVAYAVVVQRPLVDWFVATPIAWSVALLANIVIGSRSTFRATEYLRFGDLVGGALAPLRGRLAALRGDDATVRVDDAVPRTDVLGMNDRNRLIARANPPEVRALVDKPRMKRRFVGLGIPAPDTYAIVDRVGDLPSAAAVVDERDEFVVKPGDASGGEGVLVVAGRSGDTYRTSKGPMRREAILGHVRRILQGQYTGLELADEVIVEERLHPSPAMAAACGVGVPDVRVIVYRGFPIMTMSRLPTRESEGAANLHKGAVGVGLSLADGRAIRAYQQSHDRTVETHPDTGADLAAFRVPRWDDVLTTATHAAAASGLGYAGVDVVLDAESTPQVLEVNVRPGLGIQNTTGAGLARRIAFVDGLPAEWEFEPAAGKVAHARRWDRAGWRPGATPDDWLPAEWLRPEVLARA